MLFTFSGRHLHVVLAAWLVLHLLVTEASSASATTVGSLRCNPNTLVAKEKSRTSSCAFSLDDTSLFAMEEFTFYGMDDGAEPSVYTMTKTTLETLEDGSEETLWMGSLSGVNFGLASLVLGSNGGLAGNFNTAEAAYSVIQIPDATILVREMLWKDAIEPSSPIEQALLGGRSDITDTKLSTAMAFEKPKTKDTKTSFGNGAVIKGINRKLSDHDRKLQGVTNVALLILVTNRAMCESAELAFGCQYSEATAAPMIGFLSIALAQTNGSLQEVGVPVSISAQVIFLEPPFDIRPNNDALAFMETSQDIDGWRDEYEADLVTMIAGKGPAGQAAGIAVLDGFQSVTGKTYHWHCWFSLRMLALVA